MTSPAPVDGGPTQYPQFMSQHQKTQGYSPSFNSMFSSTKTPAVASSILFEQGYPQPLYPPNSYPHPGAQPSSQVLKHVDMPRECLPRFIAIAKGNTMINRLTCGLLLGKDKGHKFVVTTMLIPKQHSTSDTCTMDEEELVLRFTEERNLITLGWIYTHTTQPCFMSSVDLHTHSEFQRTLPESFAVVCAPRHNPNFGIFRLTDPPGLQTILTCTAKEAFHPHPDQPIYTDADKGHVQMKEAGRQVISTRMNPRLGQAGKHPVFGCCKAFTKPCGFERRLRKCNGPRDLNATMLSPSVLPPKQLLPAVDAGMPLQGLAAFPASPQSDLDVWSPKELISVPADSSPDSYIPNKLPASPTFMNIKAIAKGPFRISSNLGVTNALSFDSSFPVPSSSTSSDCLVSPTSAFVEDDQLSPLISEQMLASYLPLDDALSMCPCPPTLGAVDTTINASFPSPIDHSSTGDFSFLSFETTDSSLTFDSGLPLPSSSSFEQRVHTTDSFSLL
ncbi:uncharacterized protein ARMOST_16660 [Armillaria ostoyae]|uniref:MPN domain-containing protein n=1 Tax=Armillaria ostoyae TaxID=47428 RepID=A0A284RWU9_ARMOS|nr:uncharacterized protein ARMOST_16660 [Armillaria ostoyae]